MSQTLFSSGTLCIAGFLMFASGTSIKINGLGSVIKRCAPTTIAKLAIGFAFGFAFIYFFGVEGVLGINGVAFVSVICACNPGVYMGCIQDYGEPEDLGNFAILNVLTTPAIPMLIIATASGSGFNALEIVSVLVPFLLGLAFGNIDPNISKMFQAATPLALPFLGMREGVRARPQHQRRDRRFLLATPRAFWLLRRAADPLRRGLYRRSPVCPR